MINILAYDIGTSGMKTCIFSASGAGTDEGGHVGEIKLLAMNSAEYGLYTFPGGGAEQHADEWWQAAIDSTARVMRESGLDAEDIDGISFCSQMQALVLVDEEGIPVRNPMSYMDQRAAGEMKRGIGSGLKVQGLNVHKLLKSLKITGAVPASVKDPVWKYLWVKKNEPEAFSRAYKWLDVKEYFIARMTGKFVMTKDSAFGTMLYDSRDDEFAFSDEMCEMLGVDISHLPDLINADDIAGTLRAEQACELGLCEGIPVFGGGGDASLLGVGSGCVSEGETHAYWGTSGWISTVTDKRIADTARMIATVPGAQEGKFNYFAEMETAGKCLEWVKDHLALDEIGIYLEKRAVTDGANDNKECINVGEDPEKKYGTLYQYLDEVIGQAEPGAGGVIFAPWLHGNRCPFEDPDAAGMFFNISLETGKTDLIRAVVEGVCYHLKWMLECEDKKVKTQGQIRFCGGGAVSPQTAQILADIIARPVEVPEKPQLSGSRGAAMVAAVGLGGFASLGDAASMIKPAHTYIPNPDNRKVYDRNYKAFKKLYSANKEIFKILNR